MATNRLGELLVREKLISLQQLRQAQDEQKKSGKNLGYALARLGFVNDEEITNFLSNQYRLPAVNLDEFEIDGEVLKIVSKDVCMKHGIVPVINRHTGERRMTLFFRALLPFHKVYARALLSAARSRLLASSGSRGLDGSR